MRTIFLSIIISCFLFACSAPDYTEKLNLENTTWDQISQNAYGSDVTFMMWQGSPVINDYINNYVVPMVKEKHNINLKITGGQGPEIVQLLMDEKQAGVENSQADMVWINGETFFQLKQIDALFGPFVQKLPNSKYIDFNDPFINTDFQQKVNFMESPWSISQFALVYDTTVINNPPKTLPELEAFVKANPGTFTISNDFSGMTMLKCMLAELSGSPTGLDGKFDAAKYEKLSAQLWDFINRNKQYFWKAGKTFPKEHTKMDQMFATGELKLIYGFNEGGIEDKVRQGLFSKSTKAYAWENGTILNANFLGIPKNSPNKEGAMQVINFFISPEAQFTKSNPDKMDANPILAMEKLPRVWQEKFAARKRLYGTPLEELSKNAISEPAPEYMLRVFDEFRTQVIEK